MQYIQEIGPRFNGPGTGRRHGNQQLRAVHTCVFLTYIIICFYTGVQQEHTGWEKESTAARPAVLRHTFFKTGQNIHNQDL